MSYFAAKSAHLGILNQMLSTLLFCKDQIVQLVFRDEFGIKVTAEKSKTLQARAYLRRALFTDWVLANDNLTVYLNLSVLLQCLNFFGGNIVCFDMKEMNGPIFLSFDDGSVFTNCKVATLVQSEPMTLLGAQVCSRVQLKASIFREFLSDFDLPGSDDVVVSFSPDEPFFSFTLKGDSSFCEIAFSNDPSVFLEFESQHTVSNRYLLPYFKIIFNTKSLAKVDTIGFRLRSDGFLSVMHSHVHGDQSNFIEFVLAPLEDDG